MLSFSYMLGLMRVFANYPSILMNFTSPKKIQEELYRRKMKEWEKLRITFKDAPRETLGFKIYLNPNDMSQVSSSIGTVGWIDLAFKEVVRKFLKKGMTFVDVGANIGFYTLLAARLCGPSSTIISFEPEDTNFLLLQKSIAKNGFNNVILKKQAVSDKNGVVDLYLAPPTNPEAHSIIHDHKALRQKVESTTLVSVADSMKGKKVDFLKMNVGCENLILSAASYLVERDRPIILMSFISSSWKEDGNLLKSLYTTYDIFRIRDSPFLLKRIEMNALFERMHTEILLRPRIP